MPRFASSSAAKPEEKDVTKASSPKTNVPKSLVADDSFFTIQHRPFESIFDNLWKATASDFPFSQHRELLRQMNDLTKSRMDRWMLSPSLVFPRPSFGDLGTSLDVWSNAKFDEEKTTWSLPFKVPNIFKNDNISVSVVKDRDANSYMLRILGRREVDNAEKKAVAAGETDVSEETADARPDEDTEVVPNQPAKVGAPKSKYQYKLEFQLPPLPSDSLDMSHEQVMEYYSPITAQYNADEGLLTVQIPDSIVTPQKVDANAMKEVKDEFTFNVPIQALA